MAVLLAPATSGAESPKSIPWEETASFKHLDDSSQHRVSEQLLMHQRNHARAASAPKAQSQDVGSVAVVTDNGAILIPPEAANPFDLPVPGNITWMPAGGGFGVQLAPASFDPNVGGVLPLTDDDTVNVPLPFAFPFLGESYDNIFVNSDGNITLGAGDSESAIRDAARMIGGPPRIAPLLDDLDPGAGGSVSARVAADRVVITWTNVPEFSTPNANTFQATLHSNGTIDFAYSRIETVFGSPEPFGPPGGIVVGVAEGNDLGPVNEIDLAASLPATFAAGAIFEEFQPGHGTQVDLIELSHEFYRTHGDKYDFLVTFTDFPVDLDGAFAFNLGIKNQTRGVSLFDTFDVSAQYGSGGELESFVMMNQIGLFWPDEGKLVDPPIKMFSFLGQGLGLGAGGSNPHVQLPPDGAPRPISFRARSLGTVPGTGFYTLGLDSAMSIMAQEVGHRWMAFVPFVHPVTGIGPDSFDLLGRDFEHWSFFFNAQVPPSQFPPSALRSSSSSSMEGNAIVDRGSGVGFCANPGENIFNTRGYELVDGYTELDQYLMGLRQASEVSPFWYVDEPTLRNGASAESFRVLSAFNFIELCGKRVDLTVADIQAFPGIGPRVPAIGDEIDQDANGAPKTDVKTMAFILLVQQGSNARASAIGQVDNMRRTWQTYGNGPATGGRGRFDTSLNPVIY